ncbi:hypothetical protein COHA_009809 [Chlorella ohadii]|uniref:Uncharacterized protein n=1 Tax=Chlorella ohadii TaxID=2649997 RepID=A0AAD5GXH8_9CHLO|nr:hypothetical protein COHA_009809 [Chlorella ohadii]
MLQAVKDAAYRAIWSPSRIADQSGRVYIITGADSGLGFEMTKALAQKNATVVMACRNEERAEDAIKRIRDDTQGGSLHYMHVDLASLKSVRSFAEAFLARSLPLHCLINNAGLGLPHEAHTEDGFETTIGVNFYSHLLLTHLLLPHIKKSAPARIVFMCSPEESRGFIPWDDMKGAAVDKSDFNWYGTSNLLHLMAAKELADRLQGSGADVFMVQPGMSQTDFFPKMDYSQTESTMHNKMQQVAGQPAYRGAHSSLYAATEPSLEGTSAGGPARVFGPWYWAQPLKLFGRGSWQFPMTANLMQCHLQEPSNALARDAANRQRLYEAACDALEEALHSPLPNRIVPPAAA